jgi:hypothetical protein
METAGKHRLSLPDFQVWWDFEECDPAVEEVERTEKNMPIVT